MEKILCPVCGKYSFDEPGDWRYCEICGWQNDLEQYNDRNLACSTNELSVNEYRIYYQKISNPALSDAVKAVRDEHYALRRKIHEKYTGANCSIVDSEEMKKELLSEHISFMKKIGDIY